MVAVTREVAAELTGRCSTDDATLGVVLFSLRRSLAREAISEELYDDLEAVLGEFSRPDPDEVGVIADGFRKTTTKLVEIVPYLVKPYPIDEIRRVIDVSAEHPCPEHAQGHVVRFGLAILSILDLMGDDAS
ncbi:hypothetical protein ACFY1U_50110 [Streptomyces sp. NPDC001351]|uniref:hypothetical protein n=1 Tax=Streptomyces sp. NPDC001351 TaxID=3364564 RepID=UPI0036A7996E